MLLTWCGRNRFRGVCTTIFLCCLLHTGSAFGSETTRSGQEIYEAACSSCHGLDGSGREQSRVGFDTPLPDFADCHFAAREPSSDWVAVAHQGGPARKFSHLMPDSLAADGVSCILCHQITGKGFGSRESFTAGFDIDTGRRMGNRAICSKL